MLPLSCRLCACHLEPPSPGCPPCARLAFVPQLSLRASASAPSFFCPHGSRSSAIMTPEVAVPSSSLISRNARVSLALGCVGDPASQKGRCEG